MENELQYNIDHVCLTLHVLYRERREMNLENIYEFANVWSFESDPYSLDEKSILDEKIEGTCNVLYSIR